MKYLFLFPQYKFIQSFIYIIIDSWIFIPWVIIKYYYILLLKLFHLPPLGALSVGSYVSSTCIHQCGFLFAFLSTSLPLSTKRYFRLILYISCPTPGTIHLSEEKFLLLVNSIKKPRCEHQVCLLLLRYYFLWTLSDDMGKEYTCRYLCSYFYKYFYL